MMNLHYDLIVYISKYLLDRGKLNLTQTCKKLDQLKHVFTYDCSVSLDRIQRLTYFDQFTHVRSGNFTEEKYPKCAECVEFIVRKNYNPSIFTFSPRVTHLFFDIGFRKPVTIPSTVTHVKFEPLFKASIYFSEPSSLVSLICSKSYNESINHFPKSLTNLDLGSKFDVPIDGVVFPNLKSIKFGCAFNRDISANMFPQLTHMELSDLFVQSIEGVVPTTVTHLTFGSRFDQSVSGHIPESVTHLTFGSNFNRSIYNSIPANVTHLTFGTRFNKPISDLIHRHVTNLTFGKHFNQCIADSIPLSVTHLTFGEHFNQPIAGHIPASVEKLIFGYEFNQSIREIPLTVKFLQLGAGFKQPIQSFPNIEQIMIKVADRDVLFINGVLFDVYG